MKLVAVANSNVKFLTLGTTNVSAVYLGNVLIWPVNTCDYSLQDELGQDILVDDINNLFKILKIDDPNDPR